MIIHSLELSEDSRPLRPLMLKELADLYQVHRNTLRRWIKPFEDRIGKRPGYYFSIAQVKMVFELLGTPGEFEIRSMNHISNSED